MQWVVETLNPTVDAEIAALPADMRARFVRFAELIEQWVGRNSKAYCADFARDADYAFANPPYGLIDYGKQGDMSVVRC